MRILKGIAQKDLAEYFGMSPGNLCDWEKGRSEPDIAALIKLADFFGESIDYLIGRVDEVIEPPEPLSRAKQHLIYLIRTMSDADVKALADTAKRLYLETEHENND